MRYTRFVHVLLLLIALAAPPAAAQLQVSSLQSLLTSHTIPLSLTFHDLDATWCRLSYSGTSSTQDAYSALYGGGALGQYYTQGHTVLVDTVTYLVAYRIPAKPIDITALIRTPGKPLPTPAPVTPDTSLALCLLDMRAPGSFNDIQAFSLTEALAPAPPSPMMQLGTARQSAENVMSTSNLKQLGLGIIQYAQDHNEKLPPMETAAAFKNAVYPYVKMDSVFIQPTVSKPYALNTSLSRRSFVTIDDPATMVVMYEAVPMPDNTRAVLFDDGHAKRIPESQWPALQRASHIPNAPKSP